jgi:hypothetical protein
MADVDIKSWLPNEAVLAQLLPVDEGPIELEFLDKSHKRFFCRRGRIGCSFLIEDTGRIDARSVVSLCFCSFHALCLSNMVPSSVSYVASLFLVQSRRQKSRIMSRD